MTHIDVRRLSRLAIIAACASVLPTAWTDTRREPLDRELEASLLEIDRRAASIRDLKADFVERKFTALLKKPLTSSGRILVLDRTVLWDTRKPHQSQTHLEGNKVRIHYPKRRTVEVFDLDSRLDQLLASPIPRLSRLRQQFKIERLRIEDIDAALRDDEYLALRMTALDAYLRQYIDRVQVVIDRKLGCAVRVEMIDVDGERTMLEFSDIVTNSGLAARDVRLDLPSGTRVVHPISGDRP